MSRRTAVLFGATALALGILLGVLTLLESRPVPPPGSADGSADLSAEAEPDQAGISDAPVPPLEPESTEPAATLDLYTGKYGSDRVFMEKADRLVAAVPWAIGEVRARLRLGNCPAPSVAVHLEDDRVSRMGAIMWVTTRSGIGGSVQVINVKTECLANDTRAVLRTLLHEATHCWQIHLMGNRMRALPRWLTEGLAEWASSEGEMDEIRIFCSSRFSSSTDLRVILDRWDEEFHSGPTRSFDQYVYARLAVEFLRLLHPPGDGDAFLRRFFVGEGGLTWEEELRKSSGLRPREFMERLRPWAEARVLGFLRNREEFLRARRFQSAGMNEKAIAAYEEFLKMYPQDAFAPRVMYETARCQLKVGEIGIAVQRLDALERDWPYSGMGSMVARLRFQIAVQMEDKEWAIKLGRAFLKDYSYLNPDTLSEVEEELRRLRR